MGEFRRRDNRRIGNLHAMMQLVALLQTAQDRDGRFHTRLIDQHFLEAALQRGVFLHVFAVFVERGRAD